MTELNSFEIIMKKTISTVILITFLITLSKITFSQNLVVNPGFEEYSEKPKYSATTLTYYTNWNFDYLKQNSLWAIYFRDEEPYKYRSYFKKFVVPKPYSGTAMAAILPVIHILKKGFEMGYKLQGNFYEPLKANQLYRVSFYYYFSTQSWEASDDLGVYFYGKGDRPFDDIDDQLNIGISPHLAILDSTLSIPGEWHYYSAIYKAKGGEQNFLVGSFSEKISIDHAPYKLNRIAKEGEYAGMRYKCWNIPVYYFDDFEVVPFDSLSNKN